MYNKILNTLEEIEKKENVKILYCVDAGSRAAGLSSPDSDYDVRFIYIRKDSDYLRLEPLRDVIEWQCDDTLDISGWDARKALSLGYRSNPSLLEWLYSPIVYKTTEEWQTVAETVKEYFSFKHTALHYLSIAKNNYA
ncbi:MAG: nucleotidyltransferase domain-containing protein, partial [Clostridia bacterium]|nr:nucleotidyltransferase domain-containing protein [Clostridia bacterium]